MTFDGIFELVVSIATEAGAFLCNAVWCAERSGKTSASQPQKVSWIIPPQFFDAAQRIQGQAVEAGK